MKPQTASPHCRPPSEDDLDDRICSCSPEPYWIEWLEEQERKEHERKEKQKQPDPSDEASEPNSPPKRTAAPAENTSSYAFRRLTRHA